MAALCTLVALALNMTTLLDLIQTMVLVLRTMTMYPHVVGVVLHEDEELRSGAVVVEVHLLKVHFPRVLSACWAFGVMPAVISAWCLHCL